MKQGNPTKRFGIISLIGAMISGMTKRPEGVTHSDLVKRRTYMLTNGGIAPILYKERNQRQKRKLKRQTGRY